MAKIEYHIIYKTTNLLNGKLYIGIHSTFDLEDGYIGSGRIFLKAVKKYGKENFKREVLFQFNTRAEAEKKEEQIVCSEFVKNENCYNVAIGGRSGNGLNNKGRKHSKAAIQAIIDSQIGVKLSESTKKKISEAHKGRVWSKETIAKQQLGRDKHRAEHGTINKGWKQSESARAKMSKSRTGVEWSEERKLKRLITGRKVLDVNTGKVYPTIKWAYEELKIPSGTAYRNIKKENYFLKYY